MMQPLLPVGPDLWRLTCPRSLNFSPPGDWTLALRRDGGRIAGVEVGCWLARRIALQHFRARVWRREHDRARLRAERSGAVSSITPKAPTLCHV